MAGDARAKELIDIGDRLFTKRLPLLNLHQEIAENFYPERADFLTEHYLGEDFADHLLDSFPVLMRRELGNSVSAMLRPRDRPWFKATTLDDETDADEKNARYLEYLTRVIRRGMYDTRARFVQASKQGDHDFVTFGQTVISVEESPNRDHLFFRNHHLRDVVWLDNNVDVIDHAHRNDSMTARTMIRRFGEKNMHESILRAAEKEPGKAFPLRVIVMPRDEYDYICKDRKGQGKSQLPFVVIYVDKDNGKVIREGGLPQFLYAIPRWHRVSGSQYAFSPATIIALPDGRLAQQMGRILLEAGEKQVDPPTIATEEAVREVNLAAGSTTWVDYEYDERLGNAIRPLDLKIDMRTGFAMRQDFREMLTKAFFLDKLTLPAAEKADMTAYEVSRRLEEYVRSALPLFEPMEVEYNTQILDLSFGLLSNMGRFDFANMPDALSSSEFHFAFESPIQAAASRTLVSQFGEVLQLLAAGQQAGVGYNPINLEKALRDAIRGTSAPADWRKSEAEIAAELEQAAEQAQMQKALAEAEQVAEVAGKAGEAAGKVRDGMAPPQAVPGPTQPAVRAA